MILVLTGTHNQGFDRLIKAIDKLAESFEENFLIQTGNSKIKPKNCKWKKFFFPQEMEKKIKESSLVITHGGAGSIINSLKNRKPIVIVPREKKFKEHVNNHQIDLAKALEKENKAVMEKTVKNLGNAIKKARNFVEVKQNNTEIIKEIKFFLEG